jgi:pimeloyl-ACP methyl ester carboxylesterase
LVLLLHGFGEFWWAWRHQLPALASAGLRPVAMDLRGYGGSDKTPRGYDPVTSAQDVSAVVKALGERSAVLVGHGVGGYVAWATAALHPDLVSGLCVVSAPHPLTVRPGAGGLRRSEALRRLFAVQLPWWPERRLADASTGTLRRHLESWSAPGSTFPDAEEAATYEVAIGLWPAAHCALEYDRWLLRAQLRSDGRRFRASMRRRIETPVCSVLGAHDPAVPAYVHELARRRVGDDFSALTLPGAGHFPHEEQPARFTQALLAWLEPRFVCDPPAQHTPCGD